MGRSTEDQPPVLKGGLQLSQNIPFWPHLYSVVYGKIALIHLETIVMLRYRNDIFSSCRGEGVRPEIRVKLFCRKKGNEIFIAEIFVRTISFDMMFVFGGSLNVHVTGIPLVSVGGYTVESPMDEDAEFSLCVPEGHFEICQG